MTAGSFTALVAPSARRSRSRWRPWRPQQPPPRQARQRAQVLLLSHPSLRPSPCCLGLTVRERHSTSSQQPSLSAKIILG